MLRETKQSSASYGESQQANQKQEATPVWEEKEPFFLFERTGEKLKCSVERLSAVRITSEGSSHVDVFKLRKLRVCCL